MLETLPSTLEINKGTIIDVSDKDGITVYCDSSADSFKCGFLRTSAGPIPLFKKGDRVLLTLPDSPDDKGCILGKIEDYSPEKSRQENDKYLLSRRYPIKDEAVLEIEDEVVKITADKGIVIRCGKGSITITEDGRINIEGRYLLSRSKGVNKIKGSSVKIN